MDNDGQQGDMVVETDQDNAEEVTQELTQTDHLNKKLLEAFLSRINTTNDTNTTASSDSPVDSSEWADDTT